MSFIISALKPCFSHRLVPALLIAGTAVVGHHSSASDRFIVPVPDSSPPADSPSPPAPSPSPPSSSGSSSSSDSSSYSPPSDSRSSPSQPHDHRFNVPVPRSRPSRSDGHFGSGHSHGSGWYDWHSAECYYWGGRYYYGDGYYYSPFGNGIGFDRGGIAIHYNYAPRLDGSRFPIFF